METDKSVAVEIIKQLGGAGKIMAMTGVKTFISESNAVSFRFKGSKKANWVKIKLNAMDTYDIEFKKIRGMNFPTTASFDGVYNDQLKSIFESTTGLYLSL